MQCARECAYIQMTPCIHNVVTKPSYTEKHNERKIIRPIELAIQFILNRDLVGVDIAKARVTDLPDTNLKTTIRARTHLDTDK